MRARHRKRLRESRRHSYTVEDETIQDVEEDRRVSIHHREREEQEEQRTNLLGGHNVEQGDRNNMMVDASGGDTKNDLERGFFGSSKASLTLTKASLTFNLFLILMPGLWIV